MVDIIKKLPLKIIFSEMVFLTELPQEMKSFLGVVFIKESSLKIELLATVLEQTASHQD
jgi:hypothetical protein